MEATLYFHHSKLKLNLQILICFPIAIFFIYLTYIEFTNRSLLGIVIFLFFAILFSSFLVAAILKMFRNYPYIIVTNDYLQLHPGTKSETTIDYEQIKAIEISETAFQKNIEIVLHHEGEFYKKLSTHNKTRLGPNSWFGHNTIIIGYKVIPRQERPALFAVLDRLMTSKEAQLPKEVTKVGERSEEQIEESGSQSDLNEDITYTKKEFIKKYDTEAKLELVIDRTYFKKQYGYGLFIFVLMAIFPFFLMESGNGYLLYIIVSFFTYPFAKLVMDIMGYYKLRKRLKRQKGLTVYFERIRFIFEALLFHLSIFFAPLGLIYVGVRYLNRK